MPDRRTLALVGIGVVLVLTTAVLVVGPGDFFLPEQSTVVTEAPTGGEVLKRGEFVGTGHDVAGTVALVRDGDGLLLRFQGYDQEQGPDVFLYLTPSGTPDTAAEIDAGRKLRVDGGADGGESTVEGTFQQRLDGRVNVAEVGGVAVWCEAFGVPFGYATLEPVGDQSGRSPTAT